MLTIRKSHERGRTQFPWLDSWHSFSFGDYRDPQWMGFRSLRVINDDIVAPRSGFDPHPHRDMEIISVVLEGALTHGDAIGDGHREVLRPGEVQRISAGTGMVHSEHNLDPSRPVRLLQIWLRPDRPRHEPRYGQKAFDLWTTGQWTALVAPEGRAGDTGALEIHQDAWLYSTRIAPGASRSRDIAATRAAWVQIVTGKARVNGREVSAGDAAAIENESNVTIEAAPDSKEPVDVLLFDLA